MNQHPVSRFIKHGLFYSLLFIVSGCISLSTFLPSSKIKKAENVKFLQVPNPYKSISNPGIDRAWQNYTNGNTLAFSSECDLQTDLTLKAIEQENLSALNDLKILDSQLITFNEREGLETVAEGQVDGVSIRIALVIFKKNNCNFTLSYVGRKKYFESDLPIFKTFKEGFRVP